jgi:hypothetical protein
MDDRLTTMPRAVRPPRGASRRALLATTLGLAAGLSIGAATQDAQVALASPNRRKRNRRKDNNRSKSTESSTNIPGAPGQPGQPGQVIDSDTGTVQV